MLVCTLVSELLGQTKVYHIHLIPLRELLCDFANFLVHPHHDHHHNHNHHLLVEPHQEVIRLHVSMDEVLPMDKLDPAYQLVSQQENGFEAEFAIAEVEEVLQTRSQELHHHHVVLALAAVVLHKRDPHSSLHYLGAV